MFCVYISHIKRSEKQTKTVSPNVHLIGSEVHRNVPKKEN